MIDIRNEIVTHGCPFRQTLARQDYVMAVVQNVPVYGGGDQQGKGGVFGAVLESDVPRQRVQVLKDPSDLFTRGETLPDQGQTTNDGKGGGTLSLHRGRGNGRAT